jgi:diaminopimelate epimerase
MRIEFTKMHGLGNDFIVFDAPAGERLPSSEQLRRLAARRTGVGFDQALVLEPPRRPGSAVYYRIFNADGGEVEQCGNGARCVARLLQLAGRAAHGDIRMDSPGGFIEARIEDDDLVSVNMGVPNFDPTSLPFDTPADASPQEKQCYRLEVGDREVQFGAVSIGNPHIVIAVPAVDTAPVAQLGPALETHAQFPRRVNVGFAEMVTPERIRLRVHERGVGETLACGTGACAAVALGVRHGRLRNQVEVELPGGRLSVSWNGPGHGIWLKGPATVAFRGSVEIAE